MGGLFGGENSDPLNPVVMGAGKIQGGTYDSITIAGSAKVMGEVNATVIKSAGTAKFQGDVAVKTIEASGSTKIAGNVVAGRFVGTGSPTIRGNLQARELEIGGMLTVHGSVETSTAMLAGGFMIGNLLKADSLQITLNGNASVKDIQGTDISVRRAKPADSTPSGSSAASAQAGISGQGGSVTNSSFVGSINVNTRDGKETTSPTASSSSSQSSPSANMLTTETITGKTIYLEATRARLVRGTSVTLGPDCEIDEVIEE